VLLILVVTGFYISNPLAIMTQKDVSQLYTMGWFRYLHFAAAYLFFFNFMARIYWGFVGNKYASWRQFIPISKQFVSEMWTVIKMDILLLKGSLKDRQHLSVGHNALAGMTYFLTFIMFLVQCLTGFGLYASMSDWWFPNLFSWVRYEQCWKVYAIWHLGGHRPPGSRRNWREFQTFTVAVCRLLQLE
jgi:Ni/Fe-hydrogenase 1 B-type cytochrome subunit